MTHALITLDFETYYDDLYSLSKQTTYEYISDVRFKVHMCALGINNDPITVYAPIQIPHALAHIRNTYSHITLLCQNTLFDGLILAHHYNFIPDEYRDTRAMAKALNPHQSAALGAVAERLFPDDPSVRKGTELAMSKGVPLLTPSLFATLAGYCAQDVRLTRMVYDVLLPIFPASELPLIDMLTRWATQPALLMDYDLIKRYIPKLESERYKLITNSRLATFAERYNPDSKNRPQFVKDYDKALRQNTTTLDNRSYFLTMKVLNSNTAFAAWMRSVGLEVPRKINPKGKQTYAFAQTDVAFMHTMETNPKHNHVWEARASAKSTQALTRAKRFIQTADIFNGRMPTPLGYNAAHTGRLGGIEGLNLQNLERNAPTSHPDGDLRPGVLRRALLAPAGSRVLVGDLSNIEARILALLANHTVLLNIFRSGGDPYSWMAERIYLKPINKHDTPFERNVGKVTLLGLGYGMAAPRFENTLRGGPMGMPPIVFEDSNTYARIVEIYRRDNAPVVNLWAIASSMLGIMYDPNADLVWKMLRITHERIWLPSGLSLHYPNLHPTADGWVYEGKHGENRIYGASLVENLCQALTNCIMKTAMVATDQYLRTFDGGQLVLQVHDELVGLAPEQQADTALAGMLERMTRIPAWAPDLPIDAEGAHAPNYCK